MSDRRSILAVYRPIARDVAVFVEDGGQHGCVALKLHEARALHAVLGCALMLADRAHDPVSAVPA